MKYTFLFLLILTGCQFPTNQIGTVASNISAETSNIDLQARNIVKTAKDQSITNSANSIINSNNTIINNEKQLLQVQKQLDNANVQVKSSKAEADKYKQLWNGSWFGGKTWHLIYIVVGIFVVLLIADAVLFLITKFTFLNPITLVISLIRYIASFFGKTQ